MSGLIMGLVFEEPITENFGRPEKMILLAYADHADQNGRNIFPSIDLICKKTGYKERQTQKITRSLEEQGYLIADGIGKNGTNRWRIPVSRTQGGVKIAPQPMLQNAPEENAPEENAPDPSTTVKESTATASAPPVEENDTTQNIYTVYEQNIGALTPMIADRLKGIEEDYGAHWFTEAVMESVANNARNLRYVETILARWQRDGFKSDKRQPKGKTNGQRKSHPRNNAAHAQQNAGADPIAERELIERIKRRKERQHASV